MHEKRLLSIPTKAEALIGQHSLCIQWLQSIDFLLLRNQAPSTDQQ